LRPRVVLITGPPRSGKTTLVMKLLESIPPARTAGLYPEEIKEHGARKGFSLTNLSGHRSVLSHVDIKGPRRVGKYKVDIEGFNRFLEGIHFDGAEVVVVDEIGKMEAMSTRFRELITKLMASGKTVVATIALRGDAFIEGVKKTPGVKLFTLTPENRGALLDEIKTLIEKP